MDVRHEPLGEDAHGVIYWYLDLGPEAHTSLTGDAFSNWLHLKIRVTVERSCVRCDETQRTRAEMSSHECPLQIGSQASCVFLARLPIAVLTFMYVKGCDTKSLLPKPHRHALMVTMLSSCLVLGIWNEADRHNNTDCLYKVFGLLPVTLPLV